MLYKLRHKPTGYFAINIPSKYIDDYTLLKLSDTGGMFVNMPKKPTVDVEIIFNKTLQEYSRIAVPCEWEIVCYELFEVDIL